MGKRGPAPSPTKLKILHGEKNHDRFNDDEPEPAYNRIRMPDDLSIEVQSVWLSTVLELEAMGLAFSSDVEALRCFCEAVVQHKRACALLARSSVLVKGQHGFLVKNPGLQVQRDTAMTIRSFAQEFGLTPSARTSIRLNEAGAKAANPGGDNPYADTGS